MAEKARYWTGVLYTENMIADWQDEIGDIVQLPFAYCVHNDVDEEGDYRKEHVHIIIAWGNTTTYNSAFKVFDKLSILGKRSVNRIESVISIRQMYEYLIHNTETCKKKGKKLYPKESRITGNNFDIGSYEQLTMTEKNNMCRELCDVIINQGFTNFSDFYMYIISNFDDINYFELLRSYSGLFERLTKGNWQRKNEVQSIRQTQGCFNKKAEEEELHLFK